jgi:hypothetical protein
MRVGSPRAFRLLVSLRYTNGAEAFEEENRSCYSSQSICEEIMIETSQMLKKSFVKTCGEKTKKESCKKNDVKIICSAYRLRYRL